jgi:hypothetical protein
LLDIDKIVKQLNADCKRRVGEEVKAFNLARPTLADTCPSVYADRVFISTAEAWQRCYEIWGKASLKMTYPLLHGPLTPEERRERKSARKAAERSHKLAVDRMMAQMDHERMRYAINSVQHGAKLTKHTVRDIHGQNPQSFDATYLLEHDYYSGGMHQYES